MAQSKEERNDRPPSYTAPAPAPTPAYPGVAGQQVIYMPQGGVVPQQGYVIQNVPVPAQTGCCGGRSDGFRHTAGMTTGIIHLVIAVVSIVLSAMTFVLLPDVYYTGMGAAIGGAVIFFIPAGILGILSKSKNNCVIIGYLVMVILSAIEAAYICGVEGCAAAFFSYTTKCPHYDDVIDYIEPGNEFDQDGDMPKIAIDYGCATERVTSVFVLHIILAGLCFVEFVVAIVGAAYCCGGLRCCCKSATQQRTTMMYYTPVSQVQPAPVQGLATQEADPLPQKA